MKKAGAALATTVAFIAILLAVYYVHVRFLPVDVVFYAALADALVATAIAGAILVALRRLPLGEFEKLLLVLVWLLGGYAFAISVPTILDRSLSFYILEKLDQRGGGIRADRFADVFTDEYLREMRLVDVRLTEQVRSGTVVIENGCVKLTPHGKAVAGLSRFFRLNFLPRQRLLGGAYSDALVDPFAASVPGPMGYECH